MIYKKYKTFNLCFILILYYLFFRVESFTPVGRIGHSSVLVGDKLYFFGGISDADVYGLNEVFYLDVSKSFNLADPPWVDLTQNAGIQFKSCFGTVSLNDKEQTIYLFGGYMIGITTDKDAFISNVHLFNLNSLTWNVPNIKGVPPKRRRMVNGVIDNAGKMYIFGGYTDQAFDEPGPTHINDMVILNTVGLSWSTSNSPTTRSGYAAALLSSGVIVYVGGAEFVEVSGYREVDIKQIILFDTKSLTWSVKVRMKFNLHLLNVLLLNKIKFKMSIYLCR